MRVRIASLAAVLAVLALVAACGFNPYAEPRAAWRGEVEASCLARGEVRPSAFVQPMPPLGGRGSCGLEHPFTISATGNGSVAFDPPGIMGCPMTAAIDRWVADSVQPAARTYFGTRVIAIKQIAAYGCRTRDNVAGAKLSEHAFGNALDVAGFRLADGRELTILGGWWGGPRQEQAFLRAVFAGACREFYTVLGPGSNALHANHFHLDLLLTNARNGRHYCKPAPALGIPVAALPNAAPATVGALPRRPTPFVSLEDRQSDQEDGL